MSDQPTCNSENGIDGHCDCKVPCFVPVPKKPKEPGHRLIGNGPRRIVKADDE